MFLLRAAFWLAAVAIFMPREPDLGLGSPSAVAECATCQDAAQWLHEFRAVALSSLAQVKADLEAAPAR